MICAIGKNREIGYQNKLLWDLPDDLKYFKKITKDHTVIMGQRTYESLPIKPLPNRHNIVLTQDKNFQAPGCETRFDLAALAEKYQNLPEEVFIIGGGSIYKQFLPYSQKLYLTLVDDSPEADVFFPDFSEFKNISIIEEKEYNGIRYKWVELTK
jgi:dihydrofolate reductase